MDNIWCMVGFVDLVGSTKMWNQCGSDMMNKVARLEQAIHTAVTRHGGMIVKTIGDASMFVREFPQPPTIPEMIACAKHLGTDIQQGIQKDKETLCCRRKHFQVRIGMAFGRVSRRHVQIQECKVYDYYGSTVNLASRMESKVCPVSQHGSFTLGISDATMKELSPDTAAVMAQHLHHEHVTYATYRVIRSSSRRDPSELTCRRSQRLLCFYQRNVQDLKGAAPCHTWTLNLSGSS